MIIDSFPSRDCIYLIWFGFSLLDLIFRYMIVFLLIIIIIII